MFHMKLSSIIEKYPSRYVVLAPTMYDAISKRPLAFKVLEDCILPDDSVKAKEYYEGEGVSGVFIFPTFEGDIPFEPEDAARMFQVLMGGI